MKNSFDKNGIQRFPLRRIQIDDLDKLAGLPIEKEDQALVEKVAKKISGKHQAVVLPKNEGPNDKYWIIHKRFAELREVHGKPFERFVGDWLDFLLTGSLQEKFTNQCFEEALKQERRKKIDPLSPEGAMNKNLPSPVGIEILIGGEPVTRSYHYLKRKRLLSLLFLDSEKYSDFVKLMKQIEIVCESEGVVEILKGLDRAARRKAVEEILDRLKFQINPKDVKSAWVLLEFDLFEDLGWLYDKIRNLSLLRPSFYEDFDHAYRYAKKLLKLMISEFELTFPPEKEKKGAILDYLRDTLEVYTYHHFVLKFYQQTIMPISRHEIEKEQMGFLSRIDGLRAENRQVRDELSRVTLERDQALAQSRTAKQETEQFREKLGKLDPLELTKQSRAMEAKLNQIGREHLATLDEDAVLRSSLRELDAENQKLIKQLGDLHALPDETSKSVESLLFGKRVVVFGGIGRDHYWPLLRDAGVKDSDYRWYEGYKTISQARTAEIVGWCDLVVVITSYAGHLLLYQTREVLSKGQVLLLIHNSGVGTLRQQILEKFKKSD